MERDQEPVQKTRYLYVGNLHYSLTEGDLIKLFRAYGSLENVHYVWHMTGPHRGKPRGFAFVDYSSEVDAESALNAVDGKVVGGRKLIVRFRQPSERSRAGEKSSGGFKRQRDAAADTTTSQPQMIENEKVVRTLDDKIARLKVCR